MALFPLKCTCMPKLLQVFLNFSLSPLVHGTTMNGKLCTSEGMILLSIETCRNTICPTYGMRYYKTLLHYSSSNHTSTTPHNGPPSLSYIIYGGTLNFFISKYGLSSPIPGGPLPLSTP